MASNKPTTRLRELHGSGYEIKKGQPDIRGWDVRDDSSRKFGKVQELIFDIRANKVRYMVVNIMDTKELELEKRTVLVPIGLAVLDGTDDDVMLSSVTPFQLRALPRYDKSNLGAKAERDISHVFGRSTSSTGTANTPDVSEEDVDNSFYEHDHFNEDNMQKNRRATAINPLTSDIRNTEQVNMERTGDHQSISNREEDLYPTRSAEYVEDMRMNQNLVDRNETDDEAIRRVQQNDAEATRKETDEEYIRRARKNLD